MIPVTTFCCVPLFFFAAAIAFLTAPLKQGIHSFIFFLHDKSACECQLYCAPRLKQTDSDEVLWLCMNRKSHHSQTLIYGHLNTCHSGGVYFWRKACKNPAVFEFMCPRIKKKRLKIINTNFHLWHILCACKFLETDLNNPFHLATNAVCQIEIVQNITQHRSR